MQHRPRLLVAGGLLSLTLTLWLALRLAGRNGAYHLRRLRRAQHAEC